jgi:uncharacterized membrane protein YsdA (DUF1294 family)
MMKWVFCILILSSIVFAIISSDISAVSEAALRESNNAVTLAISLAGIICLWSGMIDRKKSIRNRKRPTAHHLLYINSTINAIPKMHLFCEFSTDNVPICTVLHTVNIPAVL